MNSDFMKHSVTGNKIIWPTSRVDYQKLVKQIFKQLNIDEVLNEIRLTLEAMGKDIADLKKKRDVDELQKKMFTPRIGAALFNDGQWFDGVIGRKDKPMRPAGAADWIDDASRDVRTGYGAAKGQHWKHRLPPGWYKNR
jgi:hypothetical protein